MVAFGYQAHMGRLAAAFMYFVMASACRCSIMYIAVCSFWPGLGWTPGNSSQPVVA